MDKNPIGYARDEDGEIHILYAPPGFPKNEPGPDTTVTLTIGPCDEETVKILNDLVRLFQCEIEWQGSGQDLLAKVSFALAARESAPPDAPGQE